MSTASPRILPIVLAIVLALILGPYAFASISSGPVAGCDCSCPFPAAPVETSKSDPCALVSCPCGSCVQIVMTSTAASASTSLREEKTLPDSFRKSCLPGIPRLVERPPKTA
jgi:hypothetical protein